MYNLYMYYTYTVYNKPLKQKALWAYFIEVIYRSLIRYVAAKLKIVYKVIVQHENFPNTLVTFSKVQNFAPS